MIRIKKITTTIIAAVLTLTLLASCSVPASVMTVDGVTVSAGMYLMSQLEAYNTIANDFYGSEDLLAETYEDGKTAIEELERLTMESVALYVYVEKNFDGAGLTLSEENQSLLDYQFDSLFEGQEEYLASNGIGESTYYDYVRVSLALDQMFASEYIDGESAPTDKELGNYMDENFVSLNMTYVPTMDSSYATLEGDALSDQEDLAEDILDEAKDSEDLSEAAAMYLAEAYEAVGDTSFSEDNIDLYVFENTIAKDDTSYTEEFVEQIAEESVGDFGSYTDWNAIIIYEIIENYEELSEVEDYRESLTYTMFYEDFEAAIIAEALAYNTTVDESAKDFYSPENIA